MIACLCTDRCEDLILRDRRHEYHPEDAGRTVAESPRLPLRLLSWTRCTRVKLKQQPTHRVWHSIASAVGRNPAALPIQTHRHIGTRARPRQLFKRRTAQIKRPQTSQQRSKHEGSLHGILTSQSTPPRHRPARRPPHMHAHAHSSSTPLTPSPLPPLPTGPAAAHTNAAAARTAGRNHPSQDPTGRPQGAPSGCGASAPRAPYMISWPLRRTSTGTRPGVPPTSTHTGLTCPSQMSWRRC